MTGSPEKRFCWVTSSYSSTMSMNTSGFIDR
jgi:hypothetical protein